MRRFPLILFATPALLAALATPARATNGYFAHGYGTHYKGIAGAGVALHLDSLASATNPAATASTPARRNPTTESASAMTRQALIAVNASRT